MGNTIKMLANNDVKEVSDIYSDMHTIERCEDFHIHWRNLRMIFTEKEFEIFCSAIMIAQEKWKKQGKPHPEEGKSMPDYLFTRKVDPVHGRRPVDFMIEVQGGLPYMPKNMIHIHYKSLRLDVSHKEFLELAEVMSRAKKEFEEWDKTNVRF